MMSKKSQILIIFACNIFGLAPLAAADLASIVKRHAASGGHLAVYHEIPDSAQDTNGESSFSLDDPALEGAIPKQAAKWTGVSNVPNWVQWSAAAAWVLILGMLPVLLPIIDKRPVTSTQKCVGLLTMVTVFGGFYLFTNIILFQSVHFDRVRPMTIVECIYFMSQVITTVGYGDIVPARPRGQLFVALYVLGALTVIAMLVSDLITHIMDAVHRHQKTAMDTLQRTISVPNNWSEEEATTFRRRKDSLDSLLKPQRPSFAAFLNALIAFMVIDVAWICFFHLYPGEGKSWTEAAYMSLITLSSVGFGFFTPITEGGMIFGAFMMLLGTAALVNVITSFTEVMVKMQEYERNCKESPADSLSLLIESGDLSKRSSKEKDDITEMQFLRFGLLRKKLVTEDDITEILEAFEAYGPKNGKASKKIIEESLLEAYSSVPQ